MRVMPTSFSGCAAPPVFLDEHVIEWHANRLAGAIDATPADVAAWTYTRKAATPVAQRVTNSRPVEGARRWFPNVGAAAEAMGVGRWSMSRAISLGWACKGFRFRYSGHATREAWAAARGTKAVA